MEAGTRVEEGKPSSLTWEWMAWALFAPSNEQWVCYLGMLSAQWKFSGTQSCKTPICLCVQLFWDLQFSRMLELVARGECCLYWQKHFPLFPYC